MKKKNIIRLLILLFLPVAITNSAANQKTGKYISSNNLFDETDVVNILIIRKAARSKQKRIGCTPGELYIDGGYFCRTLEKPFKNAEQNVSSIHPGIYQARVKYSQKKKQWRIQLQPITTYAYDKDPFIPNRRIKRVGIQIHPGTRPEHSLGCILVGMKGGGPCELYESHETFNRLLDKYFDSRHNPNQNKKITVVIRTDYH